MTNQDLMSMSLAKIHEYCRRENERYRRAQEYDPRYCFELFLRAIVQQNSDAWHFVVQQYQGQVTRWIEKNSAFANSGEESQYFVNRAFEKFWQALAPEKFERHFTSLGAVLVYLKMCASSVVLDYIRANTRANLLTEADMTAPLQRQPAKRPTEKYVLRTINAQESWAQLCHLLKNEQEEVVAYMAFVLKLSAKEIYVQYPKNFSNVRQIYRIKENILKRLRRHPEKLDFLRVHGGN